MQLITRLNDMRAQVKAWRRAGERIALVPTMGNLHEGHIDLVKRARQHAERVVVSVFVNPLQFGKNEDFDKYPRTPERDIEHLQSAADALFMPGVDEVYPQGLATQTRIEVPGISDVLCGAVRPGHFSGVATVVNMLFNMVTPDVALFGEKDYQQLLVIRSMVRDLHVPVEVIGVPTVRNAQGVALSSRNQYLTSVELPLASILHKTLQETAAALRAGNLDFAALQDNAAQALKTAGFRPDYFVIRKPDLSAAEPRDKALVILVAAWLGKARLLDNISVSV